MSIQYRIVHARYVLDVLIVQDAFEKLHAFLKASKRSSITITSESDFGGYPWTSVMYPEDPSAGWDLVNELEQAGIEAIYNTDFSSLFDDPILFESTKTFEDFVSKLPHLVRP